MHYVPFIFCFVDIQYIVILKPIWWWRSWWWRSLFLHKIKSTYLMLQYMRRWQDEGNLVLSTDMIIWIGHRKEVRKVTFRALALRWGRIGVSQRKFAFSFFSAFIRVPATANLSFSVRKWEDFSSTFALLCEKLLYSVLGTSTRAKYAPDCKVPVRENSGITETFLLFFPLLCGLF